ncbi:hypothetical protein J2S53_001191 [Actinopolyspora lacussalsi]|nr:hypothetical protein [Actinopolyspora lacussalsi]
MPGSLARFAETHPVDDPEVAEQLSDAIARLSEGVTAQT